MPELLYPVDMVSQQTSATCWLACAVMIYQYKRRTTPPSSWLDADTQDFRGPITAPFGASDGREQAMRLRRMGFTDVGIRGSGTGMRPTRAPSARSGFATSEFAESRATARRWTHADRIYQMLLDLGPFSLFHFVGSISYGPGIGAVPNPTGLDSHAVVIVGVNTDRKRVYFHNPWGQSNVLCHADAIATAGDRFEQVSELHSVYYLP